MFYAAAVHTAKQHIRAVVAETTEEKARKAERRALEAANHGKGQSRKSELRRVKKATVEAAKSKRDAAITAKYAALGKEPPPPKSGKKRGHGIPYSSFGANGEKKDTKSDVAPAKIASSPTSSNTDVSSPSTPASPTTPLTPVSPSTIAPGAKATAAAASSESIARATEDSTAISRAYFKLREAWQVVVEEKYFTLPTDRTLRGIDVGASPGGWTSFLASKGVKTLAIGMCCGSSVTVTRSVEGDMCTYLH
jgi:hypothetical protein